MKLHRCLDNLKINHCITAAQLSTFLNFGNTKCVNLFSVPLSTVLVSENTYLYFQNNNVAFYLYCKKCKYRKLVHCVCFILQNTKRADDQNKCLYICLSCLQVHFNSNCLSKPPPVMIAEVQQVWRNTIIET
jgi:hypothetical protein